MCCVRSVSVEPEAAWADNFLILTRLSVRVLSSARFFSPCSSSIVMEMGNNLNLHSQGNGKSGKD